MGKIYKGLTIHETKAGRYYVATLHKSYKTLTAARKAIDKWESKQYRRDRVKW